MIKILFATLSAVLLGVSAAVAAPEFFPFDNGVGRGKPEWTPDRQAETLKTLGYDGIGYNFSTLEALASLQKSMDARGLKIYSLYFHTELGKERGYTKDLEKAAQLLQGRETVMWIAILRPKGVVLEKGAARDALDADAVKLIREICAVAKKYNVQVVAYGHATFYIETAEDTVRLVEKAGCDNLAASFNLCHELMSGNGNRLEEIIKKTASKLKVVSINGADLASPRKILRLDQGSLDVAGVVKAFTDNGYKGPIGLQCYSVPGDVDENLKANIEAWKKIVEKAYPDKPKS